MSDLRTKIAETLAGLEGVTAGPWTISASRDDEVWQPGSGGLHVAIGSDNIVAAHIARCDPNFIRQLCEAALAGLEPSTPAERIELETLEAVDAYLRKRAKIEHETGSPYATTASRSTIYNAVADELLGARAALSPNGAAK